MWTNHESKATWRDEWNDDSDFEIILFIRLFHCLRWMGVLPLSSPIPTSKVHRLPIHSSLDWIRRHSFFSHWISDGQYLLCVCSFKFPQSVTLALESKLCSVTRWCQWIEKELCELVHASVTVVESMRDFESQTIYISTHCLTCSQDHENLFERCKRLNPDLRNIKTMKHLSVIEMKSAISQEMDWGLKTVFSTERQTQAREATSIMMVFKACCRQTDRQQNAFFTVVQTLDYSLGKSFRSSF